jgi:glycosyltransferase involved in cell wall biosynthesis
MRVVIALRYINQYRQPFLRQLHEKCREIGIEFEVIYGNPAREDEARNDSVDFEGGVFVQNQFFRFGRRTLIWQPLLSHLRGADLVVVEQQSKLLLNYVLVTKQLLGRQRVAFFGHGKNLQARSHKTLAERVKRRVAVLPHWWFAYTSGVAEYVAGLGYPADRITIFNNAVDTTQLARWRSEMSAAELADARRDLNLNSDNICIYMGSMFPDRRLDFLTDICARVRRAVPDFQMLFVGSGADAPRVERFCAEHGWAHYLGPVFGRDKVKLCMLAKLMLMPGAVGLAILDSFAMRMPIITTDMPYHGPEIDYLQHGHNGLIVAPADDADCYASAVAELLADHRRLAIMAENCEGTASLLTIENMAGRFFDGIVRALAVETGARLPQRLPTTGKRAETRG